VQPEPYGQSQFTLWPGYTVEHGTRALFVTIGKAQLPQRMKDDFNHSQLVDDFWSEHRGPSNHSFPYLFPSERLIHGSHG